LFEVLTRYASYDTILITTRTEFRSSNRENWLGQNEAM